ncbi:hypothetical protein Sjap_016287 [Stephania japonica]|uniref:Cytochrome P450 n=1 Tax=Stephania japonica TaxID=461633 RepID=A0AAP0NTN1_9MAGN
MMMMMMMPTSILIISQWLPLLLLLLLPLLLIHYRRNHTKPKLLTTMMKFPPSPPKLPIIGNLHQLGHLPHRSLSALSNTLGPIMLLHLGRVPTLVVSSPDAAKLVLKTHDLSFCSRPSLPSLQRLSYNSLDIAFAPYGPYWRDMRKIFVLQLVSAKRVRSFGLVRAEEVANLINSLAQSSCSAVDLTVELFSLTSRVISRIAFGKSFEGREFDGGRFVEVVYDALEMLGGSPRRTSFRGGGWGGEWMWIIDEHLEKRVSAEAEGEEEEEKQDIIDVLVGVMRDEGSAIRITADHIKAILMNIFLAAVDTSAIIMVWGMAELARKPEVMKKAQEEIRRVIGRKGKVEESDLEQLPYLKMIVKETLRMHPPGVLLIPRECMTHCKIDGYDICPKTRVMVNVWAIGRSPDHWHNPNEFIPERFKDSSVDYKGQHFEYLPFGGGRRICPGMTMGVLNVELALANLLYCFDWKLPSGMKVEDIDMDEEGGLTVHKKTPLRLVPVKYSF